MVPLIINPIYTLCSGDLLGIRSMRAFHGSYLMDVLFFGLGPCVFSERPCLVSFS